MGVTKGEGMKSFIEITDIISQAHLDQHHTQQFKHHKLVPSLQPQHKDSLVFL